MNDPDSDAPVQGMHGVIREYACLAPAANAVPLSPVLDEPLIDVSIAPGAGETFYLTGSAVNESGPVFSNQVRIWGSDDLTNWALIRTLDLDHAVQSPEIHFLHGKGALQAHRLPLDQGHQYHPGPRRKLLHDRHFRRYG